MSKLVADPEEIKLAISKIQGLQVPSPPALLLNISNELTKPEPDKVKIIGLINEDIALSGKILQIVNSPAYGLRNKVKSVEHATNLLGLPRLKTQVVAGALRYALEKSLPGFEAISEYSHCVGIGAQLLSNDIEELSSEDAYIAGLFHEAGTMMMLQLYDDYREFYNQNRNQPYTFIKEEVSRYTVSHTVIGFMLAYRWKLSNSVCNAIYLSHTLLDNVDEEIKTLVATLNLGAAISNENVLGLSCNAGDECERFKQDAMNFLDLDEDKLMDVSDKFNELIA
ncbi:MAG: HDOD domain-containing protein [Gammaproteobacteria bacterium]|nr:HDOD domain-containing protein [Gammaproteobacteria bacterium]